MVVNLKYKVKYIAFVPTNKPLLFKCGLMKTPDLIQNAKIILEEISLPRVLFKTNSNKHTIQGINLISF